MSDKKPFEIARETVRQIAERKLAPTPGNYQAVYNEIAGIPTVAPFPAEQLSFIVEALPVRNPGQEKQRKLIEFAVAERSWAGVQKALLAYAGFMGNAGTEAEAGVEAAPVAAPALTKDFFQQIARLIDYLQPAFGSDDSRFLEQMQVITRSLRDPAGEPAKLKLMLADFSHRLSFAAEDQAEVRSTLLKLLQLIIENIGVLSVEERWLQGQIGALREAAQPPLTLRRLDEVQQRLKDVLFKQTEAKERAREAQEALRVLLATFIERLSRMSESSSSYQGKLDESLRQLEQAKSLEDIAPVLKEVIGATRDMSSESRSVRDELQVMRDQVRASEQELSRLHQELDRVSLQARHDVLTGVLNRQGLDEALSREISTVRRKETPLSVALLDIDNFKKLNDSKGHEAGDAALVHLAAVARECLRPQDTVARYGGEEFVVLLPDTSLDQGIQAMTRLQRELSARLFMTGSEKVLITFSAGVAQLASEESGADAIRRADKAMYLAKRAGKNRVLGA